jgi:hypothetical protein
MPEKVQIRIIGSDTVDLATGEQFDMKVECLNLPIDSTFVVIVDEADKMAKAGLHIEVIRQEQKSSTCDVILRADDDAEPISQSIKLSTRIQNHNTSHEESPLFVQARIIWRPRSYQPTESNSIIEADGKYYFAGIQRDVGSISIEFVLVKQPKGFEEPGSFYIMRDKVSRELFEQLVGENPGTISEARLLEIKAEWPEPERIRWPATGLSGKEAKQVADWLGGKLPTLQQWKRASGGDFIDPPKGRALPEGWNPEVWKRGPFREPWTDASDQGVALKRFADVGTSPKDESYYGCRDMAGNGTEFLRKPATPGIVDVRGRPINGSKPFLFRELDHPSERQESDPDRSSSFRVVIER